MVPLVLYFDCLLGVKWPLVYCVSSSQSRVFARSVNMAYFRPSLSYHSPLRSLFCLFLSGRFTQVLLYKKIPTLFLFYKSHHLMPWRLPFLDKIIST